MPRRKQPTAILNLQGTRRKQRHGTPDQDLKVPLGSPECPKWLGRTGKKYWRETVDMLSTVPGLLSKVDGAAIASYAEAWEEFHKASKLIERNGMVVTSTSGAVYQNPAVGIKNRALDRIKHWIGKFGLSPSDRAGLKTSDGKDDDPLSQYLKSRTAS